MRVLVRSSLIFTALCLAASATGSASEPPAVSRDLTALHDATRVLVNPHKGWYHHFPDNHPDEYRVARDADLVEFPGMDHLYIIRFATPPYSTIIISLGSTNKSII